MVGRRPATFKKSIYYNLNFLTRQIQLLNFSLFLKTIYHEQLDFVSMRQLLTILIDLDIAQTRIMGLILLKITFVDLA
jgi:hypothetical protein